MEHLHFNGILPFFDYQRKRRTQELLGEEYSCAKCDAEWVSGLEINHWVRSQTAMGHSSTTLKTLCITNCRSSFL